MTLSLPREKELARTPQTDHLRTQLAKLGNTPFEAEKIEISFADNWFLPSSVLADFRRQAVEKLIAARRINYHQERAVWKPTNHANRIDVFGKCDEYPCRLFLTGTWRTTDCRGL